MASGSSKQAQAVQDEVKEVTDEVAALADLLKDLAASTGEDLRGAASEKLQEIARRSQALADKARSRTETEIASLERKIAEKPLQSALIAFVIGLLLGAVTRR